MGDMSREPSMEEILSSIRRVIARDDSADGALSGDDAQGRVSADATNRAPDAAVAEPVASADDVLELTLDSDAHAAPAVAPVEPTAPDVLLSRISEQASRQSLAALTSAMEGNAPQPSQPPAGGDMTINAMVEAMLRPMLRQWLDANLPQMVERLVAREIARITGNRL